MNQKTWQETVIKKFIVRFAGTPPNHSDAPQPRVVEAVNKAGARVLAAELAARDGFRVSSVRQYYSTHQNFA